MTDDHRCEPVFDESGQVIGRALVSPGMSEEGKRALAEVVAAARRMFEVRCVADPSILVRQAAGRARIRALNARLRGEPE